MAIFATAYPGYQVTTVTTSATAIYNTYTYTPPGGSAITFPVAGVALNGLIVENQGSVDCFLQTASGTTGGLRLPAGKTFILEGFSTTTAASSTNVLYAYTSSGSTTVAVGLESTPNVTV